MYAKWPLVLCSLSKTNLIIMNIAKRETTRSDNNQNNLGRNCVTIRVMVKIQILGINIYVCEKLCSIFCIAEIYISYSLEYQIWCISMSIIAI